MDFRILGPLEIYSDDGRPVAVSRSQQRAALSIMLLHAGHPLTLARLSDSLWGDKQPGNPRGALVSCMYSLRRGLDLSGRLHTHPVGYSIQLANSDTLDIKIFRELLIQGRRSLKDGNFSGAADTFQRALSLWREPTLADLPATPAIEIESAALIELRQTVREALVDARLALGNHDDLIPNLRALTTSDPFRERLWTRLMLALYRAGRQAEALQAYQEARTRLVDQLGVEPGADLRQMQQRILAADPLLNSPAPSLAAAWDGERADGSKRSPARHLGNSLSAPGESPAWSSRQPRRVHSEIGSARPPVPDPGTPVPAQLPPDVIDFTGRGDECSRLKNTLISPESLTGVPVTVICGPPGVGKTTLAIHVAHQIRANFPDGQLYLQLAGAASFPHDTSAVLAKVLRVFGARDAEIPESVEERAALYRSQLADRQVLVVVDNACGPDAVRSLLPGTAGCAVIVTSGEHLGDLAGAQVITLGSLDQADAFELLKKIAGKERVESDPGQAQVIAKACDRLPLAVRIAGVKLAERPDLTLAHLAARLANQRLSELAVCPLDVRQSIERSYETLEPRLKRAFRRLALTRPGFPAWFVAVLLDEHNSDDVVDALVARSLLVPLGVDAGGQPRYRMNELLREYAWELLLDDPESESALMRLLIGCLELIDAGELELAHRPAAQEACIKSRPLSMHLGLHRHDAGALGEGSPRLPDPGDLLQRGGGRPQDPRCDRPDQRRRIDPGHLSSVQ